MKITVIDRSSARLITDEATRALQEVATRHGLTVSYSGAKFGQGTLTPKFTFSTVQQVVTSTPAGVQGTKSVPADFTAHAWRFGLDADDFGRQFIQRDRHFTVTGLRPNAPKWPVLAVCREDGKTYLFHADTVIRQRGLAV